jgi:hypothetical protein
MRDGSPRHDGCTSERKEDGRLWLACATCPDGRDGMACLCLESLAALLFSRNETALMVMYKSITLYQET